MAFHKAIEVWEGSLRTISPDVIREICLNEYDTRIAELRTQWPNPRDWMTGGRTKPEDDIMRRRERSLEQISAYIAYSESHPERPWPYMGQEVAVEVPFELDLDGIKIVGYIDQILEWPDGRLSVRDLKTGSKRPDWPFQLGVYRLAVLQEFGVDAPWGDFWMAKDGKPDPMVPLSGFSRDKLSRWFHDMDRSEKAGIYLPNPSDRCSRVCGVAEFCSAMGQRAHEYPPSTLEVAA